MLFRLGLILVLAAGTLRADSPALTVTQQRLPSPAPVDATSPRLVGGPGAVTLVWTEGDRDGNERVVSAAFDGATLRWSPPAPAASAIAPAPASTVQFPDGSVLTAFFPEEDDRILDLHTRRESSGATSSARPLSNDHWPRTNRGSEPPLLLNREARALAVWLNRAESTPRLFAALSTSAGAQFFLPARIDDGRVPSRPSATFLHDGSAYISWIETRGPNSTGGCLWLRRLSPAGDTSVPVLLATAASADALGHPQLATLKDYDRTPGQLLVVHESKTDNTRQIVVHLLKLPPAESFLEGRPCPACPPDSATLPGHPVDGIVVRVDTVKHQVVLRHAEIPGILPAGETFFETEPGSARSLSIGSHIIARTEKRDDVWLLRDARILVTPSH